MQVVHFPGGIEFMKIIVELSKVAMHTILEKNDGLHLINSKWENLKLFGIFLNWNFNFFPNDFPVEWDCMRHRLNWKQLNKHVPNGRSIPGKYDEES